MLPLAAWAAFYAVPHAAFAAEPPPVAAAPLSFLSSVAPQLADGQLFSSSLYDTGVDGQCFAAPRAPDPDNPSFRMAMHGPDPYGLPLYYTWDATFREVFHTVSRTFRTSFARFAQGVTHISRTFRARFAHVSHSHTGITQAVAHISRTFRTHFTHITKSSQAARLELSPGCRACRSICRACWGLSGSVG